MTTRTCKTIAPLLPAFADGELEARDHAGVSAHLAACADCQTLQAEESAFTVLLRQRLPTGETAPAALRAAIATHLAGPPRASRWWARPLASPWAPRLAGAVVLALLIAVPLAWWPHRAQGQAQAAARQHACHGFVPGEPLPPCCTAVAAGTGSVLGPPSPGAVVPNLQSAGLELTAVARCVFTGAPMHFVSYRSAAGTPYSLGITDRTWREFKLLRARSHDGVVQVRDTIHTDGGEFAVCRWARGRLVYTWVAPAADATGDAALAALLHAMR